MKNLLLALSVVAVLFSGCKKEENHIPPIACFSITAPQPWAVTGVVIFTNCSQRGSTYRWTFGDGSTSAQKNPTHIYNFSGDYTVTLVVTGEGGTTASMQKSVVIAPEPDFASLYAFGSWEGYGNCDTVFGVYDIGIHKMNNHTLDIVNLLGHHEVLTATAYLDSITIPSQTVDSWDGQIIVRPVTLLPYNNYLQMQTPNPPYCSYRFGGTEYECPLNIGRF